MDIPLVSIVIPAYNRQDFIASAIQSVINQNIDNIEIIIVDDCSTDKTTEIVLSIPDKRIKLIRHEKNKGEAGARNTGVRSAVGQYVAYLDSDDRWLPGKLAAQVEYMLQADRSVGGVYTYHKRLYQNGRESIAGRPASNASLTFKTLLVKGASISAGSTLLYRRELFENIGAYDESAPLYVDWDWLLRFLKISSLGIIPVPYAIYEKNPRYRKGELQEKAANIFIQKYQNDINALSLRDKNECLHRINLDIARCYAENEGLSKALPFYLKALKLKPNPGPGAILNIIDGIFKTNILSYVDSHIRSESRQGR